MWVVLEYAGSEMELWLPVEVIEVARSAIRMGLYDCMEAFICDAIDRHSEWLQLEEMWRR